MQEERIEKNPLVHDFKGNGESILLVEDDAQVRKSTKMFLVDYVLPWKNGLQLIEEIRSINEDVKAILYSGCIDRHVNISRIKEAGIMFLIKPFDIEDMLRLIKDVLRPL